VFEEAHQPQLGEVVHVAHVEYEEQVSMLPELGHCELRKYQSADIGQVSDEPNELPCWHVFEEAHQPQLGEMVHVAHVEYKEHTDFFVFTSMSLSADMPEQSDKATTRATAAIRIENMWGIGFCSAVSD